MRKRNSVEFCEGNKDFNARGDKVNRFLIVAIVLAMLSPAHATNISIIFAPIQPDVPILYEIKVKILEPLDVALSSNKELKRVEHAERRLQEALAMAQKGKYNKALEALDRARTSITKIHEDITLETGQPKAFEKSIEATIALERYKHSVDVISALLNSASMPEQSRQGLSNALVALQKNTIDVHVSANKTALKLEKTLPAPLVKDIKAKHGR